MITMFKFLCWLACYLCWIVTIIVLLGPNRVTIDPVLGWFVVGFSLCWIAYSFFLILPHIQKGKVNERKVRNIQV